jgi:hypothetical protein
MKSIKFSKSAFRLSLFVGLFASVASISLAGGTTSATFVSGQGNDSNPCTATAPCLTFARALTQTAPGGELVALSSGVFGPLTINQSVTISAPQGVYAGIIQTSSSADGVDINAGDADVVTLKGLTIVGPGPGTSTGHGIKFIEGNVLHVEGCEIRGFASGIEASTDSNLAVAQKCAIKDTTVKECVNGIALNSDNGGESLNASMDHVTLNDNGNGLFISTVAPSQGPEINAAICNSTLSTNSNNGINVQGFGTYLDVENCSIVDGNNGIQALSHASVAISNCVIANDFSPWNIDSSSVVTSRGNNSILYFGASRQGTLSSFQAQ